MLPILLVQLCRKLFNDVSFHSIPIILRLTQEKTAPEKKLQRPLLYYYCLYHDIYKKCIFSHTRELNFLKWGKVLSCFWPGLHFHNNVSHYYSAHSMRSTAHNNALNSYAQPCIVVYLPIIIIISITPANPKSRLLFSVTLLLSFVFH